MVNEWLHALPMRNFYKREKPQCSIYQGLWFAGYAGRHKNEIRLLAKATLNCSLDCV